MFTGLARVIFRSLAKITGKKIFESENVYDVTTLFTREDEFTR